MVRNRVITGLGLVALAVALGGCGSSGDREAVVKAPMKGPTAVALDDVGNLYVADRRAKRIRRVDPAGAMTTVAGSGLGHLTGDGISAVNPALNQPNGVAVDSKGNLYIADTPNNRVRRVAPSGIIGTVVGTGESGGGGDGGPATDADLSFPSGVAVGSDDSLYIADTENHRVRWVDRFGVISTVVGTGSGGYGGDGGWAIAAQLQEPSDVACDSSGNVYIADTRNNRVRMVDPSGMISTVAGGEERSFQGDKGDGRSALRARVDEPVSVEVDSAGNLFILEGGGSMVRRVDPSGEITTVVGRTYGGQTRDDGRATDFALGNQRGIAVDSSGTLYIADSGNHQVRRVTPSGAISAVASTGVAGYSGDGGPAERAELFKPAGVAVHPMGNLYISDKGNYRVRRIDPSGTFVTVVGPGEDRMIIPTSSPPSIHQSIFGAPQGVVAESSGSVYVVVGMQGSVLRIDPSGRTTVVAEAVRG